VASRSSFLSRQQTPWCCRAINHVRCRSRALCDSNIAAHRFLPRRNAISHASHTADPPTPSIAVLCCVVLGCGSAAALCRTTHTQRPHRSANLIFQLARAAPTENAFDRQAPHPHQRNGADHHILPNRADIPTQTHSRCQSRLFRSLVWRLLETFGGFAIFFRRLGGGTREKVWSWG
jgi:hypothetical protein